MARPAAPRTVLRGHDAHPTSPTGMRPTGEIGGRPTGHETTIRPREDLDVRRSLTRENEAATTLADRGYRVEQNPPARSNGKEPDYRIEGHYADCYAPGPTKSPRGIASELQDKLGTGQADRFVLNLDDWQGDLAALRRQFDQYPIPGIVEILVVRGGRVSNLSPTL